MLDARVYGPMFSKLRIPKALRLRLKPTSWDPGFIYGPPARGKSHMAASRLLGAAVKNPLADCLFASIPGLLFALGDAIARKEPSDETLLPVTAAEFLVLDDLGAERPTEWVLDQLYGIIDVRASGMKPTLVTSNVPLKEIGRQLGDRLASRIQGFGHVTRLYESESESGGKNWRKGKIEPLPANEPYLDDKEFPSPEGSVICPGEAGGDFLVRVIPGTRIVVDLEGSCQHEGVVLWHEYESKPIGEYRPGRIVVRCPRSLTPMQAATIR